jgi:phosphoserine phosphatase
MSIKVVFFDCDGTLTGVKSSWQYLHERLGLWDDHADEFQRLFHEGKIDYAEFCRRDAALWKGLRAEEVMKVIDEIPYHEGVRETMEALHGEGIITVILSTGLSLLIDKVRADLGMSLAFSNDLLVKDGVLTGDIRINVEHDNKGLWVKKILKREGLKKKEAAAIGDGEGDRGMFESVGLAIGYHPNNAVLPILDHALFRGSFSTVLDIITRER